MTEYELRESVINCAREYLGLTEGDARHKELLAIWNNHTDVYRRKYTMTIFDAWCMAFVSAMYIKAGLADLIVTECGCGEAINRNWTYKNNWTESDAYVPNTADIIMYDWDDNGKGDNTGWAEHTGLVVSVDEDRILVIEGNASDTVMYRTVKVNDRYIRGYITPDFASIADDVNGYLIMQDCYACNVRKGDNVNTEIIGTVHSGDILAYIGTHENHWHEVRFGGMNGFVSPLYSRVLPEGQGTASVYVRTDAGITNDKVKVGCQDLIVTKGETVYIIDTKTVLLTKWYKVYFKGHIGWCSGKYIKEL